MSGTTSSQETLQQTEGGSHEGSGRDKTMSRSQSGEETIVMDGNILIPLRRGDTAGMQATAGGHVIGEVEGRVSGRAEEIVTEKVEDQNR